VVCFTERESIHLRPVGSAGASTLGVRFKYGREDWVLGNDPAWELARAAFQMTRPPYLLGGLALWLGYLWTAASGTSSPVPAECRAFRRTEQRKRFYRILAEMVGLRRSGTGSTSPWTVSDQADFVLPCPPAAAGQEAPGPAQFLDKPNRRAS
jgi:hypothetical protein